MSSQSVCTTIGVAACIIAGLIMLGCMAGLLAPGWSWAGVGCSWVCAAAFIVGIKLDGK